MPAPAGFGATMPQALREGRSELQHPPPHRLVRDVQTALPQQILNVAVAQGEAEIDPYRVLDDRGRKLVPSIRDRSHPQTLRCDLTRPPLPVTMPVSYCEPP